MRPDHDDDDAHLEELRGACRERPKHLPSRLELGDLLMARGDAEAALEVYEEALRLKPSYSKARRKVEEARKLAPPPTTTVAGSSVVTVFETRAEEAAALRARGNQYFNNQCYEQAWDCYDRAIDLLKREGVGDAKLHTNRAACLLTAGRWVAAAYDGVVSIELDPEWCVLRRPPRRYSSVLLGGRVTGARRVRSAMLS